MSKVRYYLQSPKSERTRIRLTFHYGRRSFASNEYLRAVKEGRSFRPIMDILGMSKEATFLRYVKVDRLAALVDWVRGR